MEDIEFFHSHVHESAHIHLPICVWCTLAILAMLLMAWYLIKLRKNVYCVEPFSNHLTNIKIEDFEWEFPLFYRCISGPENRVCTLYRMFDGHIIQISEMFLTDPDGCANQAVEKAYHKEEIIWIPEAIAL